MKKIFVTGASGCVGHYIVEQLLAYTDCEIHVLVRYPHKLKQDLSSYPHVIVHTGDLNQLSVLKPVLDTITHLIHIATTWGSFEYAYQLNVTRTRELFSYLNPDCIQKIVYFSTASILGPGSLPVEEARLFGSGYVKSKFLAYEELPTFPHADKVVTVFPTMVFGGDETHPYSHLNAGVIPNLGYLNVLRFFTVDASFHFLHAYDISQVTLHLLFNATSSRALVLGQSLITADQALSVLCDVFQKKSWFRFKIKPNFVFTLAKLFRIIIGPWERYCITHPHMAYDTVNPETYGLVSKFPTLKTVLTDIKDQTY